jgi:hypothetical protein
MLDEVQANVNDVTVIHWVACNAGVESTNEEARCEGLKTFRGMRFSLQSLVVVCPYFVMNQSNMWRKTVFGYFMQIGCMFHTSLFVDSLGKHWRGPHSL